MKKIAQGIIAAAGVTLFAAAYAGPAVPSNAEVPGPNDQVVRAASIIITTYFSDASHSTQVGSCVLSTCPGTKGRHCTGTITMFTEVDTNSCF
jgi:hypothetical protein